MQRCNRPIHLDLILCDTMSILHIFFIFSLVPSLFDMTCGIRKDGAEAKFINLLMGKKCKIELYIR